MTIIRLPVTSNPSSVGLSYQDVTFPSRNDHLSLSGWLIPSSGEDALIVIYGGYQNRVGDPDTLPMTRDLVAQGFNVLLFDQQGRGQSSGKGVTLRDASSDLGGAVDFLQAQGFSQDDIGIIGYSSGAVSACVFASENHIGALVLDGCWANTRDTLIQQAAERHIPKLLLGLLYPGENAAVKIFYSYSPVNPVDVIGKVGCPVLLIHETDDNLVTLGEIQQLLQAANQPSTLCQVEGAAHSQAYDLAPSVYIAHLTGFFQQYLG